MYPCVSLCIPTPSLFRLISFLLRLISFLFHRIRRKGGISQGFRKDYKVLTGGFRGGKGGFMGITRDFIGIIRDYKVLTGRITPPYSVK